MSAAPGRHPEAASLAHAASDAAALTAVLRRMRRRMLLLLLVRCVMAGLALALVAVLVAWVWRGVADPALQRAAVVVALAGAIAGAAAALLAWRRMEPAAAAVERRAPHSRNVIITAAELLAASGATRSHVAEAVVSDAAAVAAALRPATLFPARRVVVAAAAVAAAWLLTGALMWSRPLAVPAALPLVRQQAGIVAVEVRVEAPVYARAEPLLLRDPERIEALVGSTLHITVRAAADSVLLHTLDGARALAAATAGTFRGEVAVTADGFFALEARSAGAVGPRRLTGISVLADPAPRVRIAAPGRDLVLPDGAATIDLDVEAEDDRALASLSLRYTRVTGFGEQFTFLDGSVPLRVSPVSGSRWTARAAWRLHDLALEPGDLLVYRAVATDTRPGGQPGESDTYVIEIGAGHVAAAGGFAGTEELDRYALSQQMVIVLTERVLARQRSLSRDELAHEATTLAAAQRRVRAEFVFMLGGELDDDDHVEDGIMELHEEAHARADADVLEGRMANQGRRDLVRAIQSMSHAVTLLNDADLEQALRAEQTALVFLQRAFSRSRYILRALTERERIDPARRLSGSLAGVASARQSAPPAEPDSTTRALRRGVRMTAELAASPAGPGAAERTSTLADEILRIDPSAADVQRASSLLSHAAAARSAGRTAQADELLEQAFGELVALTRARLRPAPQRGPSLDQQRLHGALVDALRAAGSR